MSSQQHSDGQGGGIVIDKGAAWVANDDEGNAVLMPGSPTGSPLTRVALEAQSAAAQAAEAAEQRSAAGPKAHLFAAILSWQRGGSGRGDSGTEEPEGGGDSRVLQTAGLQVMREKLAREMPAAAAEGSAADQPDAADGGFEPAVAGGDGGGWRIAAARGLPSIAPEVPPPEPPPAESEGDAASRQPTGEPTFAGAVAAVLASRSAAEEAAGTSTVAGNTAASELGDSFAGQEEAGGVWADAASIASAPAVVEGATMMLEGRSGGREAADWGGGRPARATADNSWCTWAGAVAAAAAEAAVSGGSGGGAAVVHSKFEGWAGPSGDGRGAAGTAAKEVDGAGVRASEVAAAAIPEAAASEGGGAERGPRRQRSGGSHHHHHHRSGSRRSPGRRRHRRGDARDSGSRSDSDGSGSRSARTTPRGDHWHRPASRGGEGRSGSPARLRGAQMVQQHGLGSGGQMGRPMSNPQLSRMLASSPQPMPGSPRTRLSGGGGPAPPRPSQLRGPAAAAVAAGNALSAEGSGRGGCAYGLGMGERRPLAELVPLEDIAKGFCSLRAWWERRAVTIFANGRLAAPRKSLLSRFPRSPAVFAWLVRPPKSRHWVPVYLGAADNMRAAVESTLHEDGSFGSTGEPRKLRVMVDMQRRLFDIQICSRPIKPPYASAADDAAAKLMLWDFPLNAGRAVELPSGRQVLEYPVMSAPMADIYAQLPRQGL